MLPATSSVIPMKNVTHFYGRNKSCTLQTQAPSTTCRTLRITFISKNVAVVRNRVLHLYICVSWVTPTNLSSLSSCACALLKSVIPSENVVTNSLLQQLQLSPAWPATSVSDSTNELDTATVSWAKRYEMRS